MTRLHVLQTLHTKIQNCNSNLSSRLQKKDLDGKVEVDKVFLLGYNRVLGGVLIIVVCFLKSLLNDILVYRHGSAPSMYVLQNVQLKL